MQKKIYLYFSVDDVFKSLIEITDKNIKLKNHWFFSLFYKLWKKYKIKTGLYLFYQGVINGRMRDLRQVRNIQEELNENWIYFGPHALDKFKPPHRFSVKSQKKHISKIYKEIYRFAGKNCTTKQLRLHEYSESFELERFFKKYNVASLFVTDKSVGAHRLPNKNKVELLNKGQTFYKKLNFIRTDFRIELLVKEKKLKNRKKIIKVLKNRNFITIYSHEYELKKKKCREKLFDIIKFLSKDYKLQIKRP